MKKLITLVLLLVLATTLFCGCTDNTSTSTEPNTEAVSGTSSVEANTEISDSTDKPTPSDKNKEIDLSAFPEESDDDDENLSAYRQEVYKRLATLGEDDFFFSDKEWEVLSSFNYSEIKRESHSITFYLKEKGPVKCFYPVLFRASNRSSRTWLLWYTDYDGEIQYDRFTDNPSGGTTGFYSGIKTLHIDSSDKDIIVASPSYTITYLQETGEIKLWQYNKAIKTYSMPKNTVYCGKSDSTYYDLIFRSGTDLYLVNAFDLYYCYQKDKELTDFLHTIPNVNRVIDVNYDCGKQASGILLQMKDGSIKYFCDTAYGLSVDDPIPEDIICEGGYNKYRDHKD